MRYVPCPETQNKMVSSSKGMEVVCELDHFGSQPFTIVYPRYQVPAVCR